MGERELGIALAEMFEADTEIFWEDTEAVYDHAGYMTEIGWNGKRISGEQFREKTGLPSACITMEKDGVSKIVSVRLTDDLQQYVS